MDPTNPKSFSHRTAQISTGRLYHFIDEIPRNYDATRPPLICLHGFPDSWYSWKFSIWIFQELVLSGSDGGTRLAHGVERASEWLFPTCWAMARPTCHIILPRTPRKRFAMTFLHFSISSRYQKLFVCLICWIEVLDMLNSRGAGRDWTWLGLVYCWQICLVAPRAVDRTSYVCIPRVIDAHYQRDMLRLSVPYVPLATQHMSVEEMTRKYPSYGYQIYFASETSTSEIEANVCIFIFYFTPLTQALQAPPLSRRSVQNA